MKPRLLCALLALCFFKALPTWAGVVINEVPTFQREKMTDEEMVEYLNRTVFEQGRPRQSIETVWTAPSPAQPTPLPARIVRAFQSSPSIPAMSDNVEPIRNFRPRM